MLVKTNRYMKMHGETIKIILKWIFKKKDGEVWTGLLWLMIERFGGIL